MEGLELEKAVEIGDLMPNYRKKSDLNGKELYLPHIGRVREGVVYSGEHLSKFCPQFLEMTDFLEPAAAPAVVAKPADVVLESVAPAPVLSVGTRSADVAPLEDTKVLAEQVLRRKPYDKSAKKPNE
jgi:hypothetical protein